MFDEVPVHARQHDEDGKQGKNHGANGDLRFSRLGSHRFAPNRIGIRA